MSSWPLIWRSFFLNIIYHLPECSRAKENTQINKKLTEKTKVPVFVLDVFLYKIKSKKEIKFSTTFGSIFWLYFALVSFSPFLGQFLVKQDSLHLCSASSGMARDIASARVSYWTGSTLQPREVLVTGGKLFTPHSKEIHFSKGSLALTSDFPSVSDGGKVKNSLTPNQIFSK